MVNLLGMDETLAENEETMLEQSANELDEKVHAIVVSMGARS